MIGAARKVIGGKKWARTVDSRYYLARNGKVARFPSENLGGGAVGNRAFVCISKHLAIFVSYWALNTDVLASLLSRWRFLISLFL